MEIEKVAGVKYTQATEIEIGIQRPGHRNVCSKFGRLRFFALYKNFYIM